MAVMKKKGKKELPAISTSSLPDVIYMILFFFMVSTSMRDQELLVRYKLPDATEVQKLEKKSLVSYIHIGQPSLSMQAKFGTAPRIQLNDSYKTTKDILDILFDTSYINFHLVYNFGGMDGAVRDVLFNGKPLASTMASLQSSAEAAIADFCDTWGKQ